MANIARINLPVDQNGNVVQITPAVASLAKTYDETISSSTEITLNTATTFIEVTAMAEGVFLKWGTADVTNANFDEYIAKDSTRQYYVPVDTSTNAKYTAVNFLQRAATALLVVIEK